MAKVIPPTTQLLYFKPDVGLSHYLYLVAFCLYDGVARKGLKLAPKEF